VKHFRERRHHILAVAAAVSLLAGGLATAAGAAPGTRTERADRPTLKVANAASARSDRDRGHVQEETWKLAKERQAQRDAAFQRKLEGKRPYPAGVGPAKRVPLTLEGTDRVFVILAEFGDLRHPLFCDAKAVQPPTAPQPCTYPSDGTPQQFNGPMHNQIPAPDRSVDNSTLWQPDYTREHYEDMYFNRMREYYEHQSSGRYTIEGDVTEWVKVPFNQARYGRNFCGSIVCSTTYSLLRDAMGIWVQDRLAEGMTMAEINAYLASFDIEDRYDIDHDGNYDEPDKVIDHFQIVHAGGDEAAGDPAYGTDAIWSHRSRAALAAGPGGIPGFQVGTGTTTNGANIPTNLTDYWVSDYTIQPENGGLGVFAHEFGHDLGLPDLYDTSGNTGGGENSTAFWSLMSSGANIGDGSPDGIGDAPTDLDAWSKLYLGWLDAQGDQGPFYKVVDAGKEGTVRLSDNDEALTNGVQAMIVNLPDNVVDYTLGDPAQGEFMWYSDKGSNLENTMTKTGVTAGAFTAQVNYVTEDEYDYFYVEASSDGTTFTPVDTNLSDHAGHAGHDPDANNPTGLGITGSSEGAWVEVSATLPTGTTAVRIRYSTDPAVTEFGVLVDDVKINGVSIGDAEQADQGWALKGFYRTNGEYQVSYYNAYIVENRQYDDYDSSLRTAYNFGFIGSRPDWVETHPYQPGALIWYLNDEYNLQGDFSNDVADHPGEGFLLPVDAHPQFSHWPDGTLMRPRILSADSTFGYKKTDRVTLHKEGVPGVLPSYPGQPVFDDTAQWWFNSDEHGATGAHPGRYQPGWYSVDVPKTGTTIRVAKPGSRNGTLDMVVSRN
jgi:immune inhibitor A